MKFRIALVALSALFVASCGKGGDATGGTSAAPVAAVKPPAGQNWVDVVSPTPEGGMRMGNPDAPVKLVEYGSRACPFCARFDAEGVPALRSGAIAQGKLSYEFREYPIHGPLDFAPILLGRCVDSAAFFPMLDQMMAGQPQLLAKEEEVSKQVQALPNPTPVQMANTFANGLGYVDFVKQRGVPEAKARACLNDQKGFDRIAKEMETANQQYNISGTPTFIVNGTVAANVNDWTQLQPVLKGAGAL